MKEYYVYKRKFFKPWKKIYYRNILVLGIWVLTSYSENKEHAQIFKISKKMKRHLRWNIWRVKFEEVIK